MNIFNKLFNYTKRHKYIFALLLILGIGGIFSVSKYKEKNTSQETQNRPITAQVKKGEIVSSISASGNIATANYLSVTTSVNGIVKQVFVKEGDQVTAGQQIMEITLDSEGEKSRINSYSTYLRAQNSLAEAQKSLPVLQAQLLSAENAFKDVKESNSYQTREEKTEYAKAEANYTDAKNKLENVQNQIATLQATLSSAGLDYQTQSPIITAPSDGVVASVLAVEGSKIENSVSERSIQTVASIKKEGSPIATVEVGETDINNVKVGQKVILTLSSLGDKTFEGTVAGIDKVGVRESGVSYYPVTIKLNEVPEQILPNMSVQAQIITAEKQDVLTVPTSAIQEARGKKIVKLQGGKITNVETGAADSENTEVISGLNEGDIVVIDSFPTSGFTDESENQTNTRGNPGIFPTGGFGGGRR